MKRVLVLCLDSDRETVLETLYKMGVVHVVNVQEPAGDHVERANEQLQAAVEAVEAVRAAAARTRDRTGSAVSAVPVTVAAADIVDEAVRLTAQRKAEEKLLAEFCTELERIEPLGDFDPSLIRSLEAHGLCVTLLRAPLAVPLSGPQGAFLDEIATDEQRRYYVLVTPEPFDPADLTPHGVATAITRRNGDWETSGRSSTGSVASWTASTTGSRLWSPGCRPSSRLSVSSMTPRNWPECARAWGLGRDRLSTGLCAGI